MLTIENLDAGYRRVRVLYDITLSMATGETVGVLGPNGAGKTTLLRAIAGNCTVYAGRLEFGGLSLTDKPDHVRASLGIAHVPEGRRTWPSLTVEENLMMGAWRLPHTDRRQQANRTLDYVARSVSATARAHESARRRPKRGRAANAGHRPRAHGQADTFARR